MELCRDIFQLRKVKIRLAEILFYIVFPCKKMPSLVAAVVASRASVGFLFLSWMQAYFQLCNLILLSSHFFFRFVKMISEDKVVEKGIDLYGDLSDSLLFPDV